MISYPNTLSNDQFKESDDSNTSDELPMSTNKNMYRPIRGGFGPNLEANRQSAEVSWASHN